MARDKFKEDFGPTAADTQTGFTDKRDLTRRVASGAVWSGAARVCVQLLYLISMAFLTRKLDPEAYGLMNMTQIVVGFVTLFRDVGIASAVIQRRELNKNLLCSLWWMATGLGVVTTLLCVGLAPLAALFYRQPLVANMLRVLALSFAITSVTIVHWAMLNREMSFRRLAIVEIVAAFISLIVAILFAYSGAGVWSLVAASLAGAIVSSGCLLLAYPWRPGFYFSWKDVRSVTGFGMNLSGFNVLNYFSRNADNILIGRYIGTAPLGFYQLAYTIMLYPVQNVAQLLGRVLFPAFSEIQNDHSRFRDAYVQSSVIIAMISFPLMAGAAAVAKPFVLVWMGSNWLMVATLIMILAPVGMFQAVGTTVWGIYMAIGRTDLMFRWGLISSPVIVLSFFIALPWGVKGVAISYAVATGLLAYPLLLIPCRLIELPLSRLWNAIKPVALAAGLMFLVVFLVQRSIAWMPPIYILVISIPVGVLAYLICVRIFAWEALKELLSLIHAIPVWSQGKMLLRGLFRSSI